MSTGTARRPRDDRRNPLLHRRVRTRSAPPGQVATLFRGQAWIAADSFAMIKVSAAQTGLRGPSSRPSRSTNSRAGPGRRVAAGALGCPADVRGRGAPDADSSRPGDRSTARSTRRISRRGGSAPTHPASMMLRDTPEGYRYLKRDRRTASGLAAACAGPRRPGAHDRRRRDHRSEHFGAAALCRPQLRRFQFSRHGHAGERVLRRHLRTIRVLGAVARRQPMAACRARVRRSRRLTTIGRSSTGANGTRRTSGSGRRKWRSGCCGR